MAAPSAATTNPTPPNSTTISRVDGRLHEPGIHRRSWAKRRIGDRIRLGVRRHQTLRYSLPSEGVCLRVELTMAALTQWPPRSHTPERSCRGPGDPISAGWHRRTAPDIGLQLKAVSPLSAPIRSLLNPLPERRSGDSSCLPFVPASFDRLSGRRHKECATMMAHARGLELLREFGYKLCCLNLVLGTCNHLYLLGAQVKVKACPRNQT